MTRIRVAIVDDHPALREGTAVLLKRDPDRAKGSTTASPTSTITSSGDFPARAPRATAIPARTQAPTRISAPKVNGMPTMGQSIDRRRPRTNMPT